MAWIKVAVFVRWLLVNGALIDIDSLDGSPNRIGSASLAAPRHGRPDGERITQINEERRRFERPVDGMVVFADFRRHPEHGPVLAGGMGR